MNLYFFEIAAFYRFERDQIALFLFQALKSIQSYLWTHYGSLQVYQSHIWDHNEISKAIDQLLTHYLINHVFKGRSYAASFPPFANNSR